jgi:hypothetical protein
MWAEQAPAPVYPAADRLLLLDAHALPACFIPSFCIQQISLISTKGAEAHH